MNDYEIDHEEMMGLSYMIWWVEWFLDIICKSRLSYGGVARTIQNRRPTKKKMVWDTFNHQ